MNKDGHRYSSLNQFGANPISRSFGWLALLRVLRPPSRAVTSDDPTPAGLPAMAQNLFLSSCFVFNLLDLPSSLFTVIRWTDTSTGSTQFMEPAFVSDRPLYLIQPQFTSNATSPISLKIAHRSIELAYDSLNSDENSFSLNIAYTSMYNDGDDYLVCVPRSVNLASNVYLKFHNGPGVMAMLEYLEEMPKTGTQLRFDISSILNALFFTWIIELLFPVMLTYLVYERQQKLKIMMNMPGLKGGPYWLISSVYFFSLSSLYMICFVIFGSLIGLKFFRLSDYNVQTVFYFLHINLQTTMAFLASTFFSSVKTATATGYIYVFGSALLRPYLLKFLIGDTSFPRTWIIVMKLIPGFSWYCGLYEFSQYSFQGDLMGTSVPTSGRSSSKFLARSESRAVTSDHFTPAGLPDESCKVSQSCPASVLFTGGDQSFAQILEQSLFLSSSSALNLSDFPSSLSTVILGTDISTGNTQFMEPAFVSDRPLYLIQPQCASNATSPISFKIANRSIELELQCYQQENSEKKINEFIAAYDFLNSDENSFNLNIGYNSTYNGGDDYLVGVPRSVNLA
ncbi:hypothetical protein OPV22_015352 [Ensete ventricosum]|uniref:ABC-2 type transporter domain-containing protein n=1 Tax=Ensete ventricosum TaxID=4639 RepID=A0AAV8R995_ENSVE|nr:hypothetical protein OPV22_015352 [Ensete ventricosum]